MYKIFAIISLIFLALSIISFIGFRIRNNSNFDMRFNWEIRRLVNQIIIMKYITHSTDALEGIITERLQKNLDDWHPNFFRDTRFHFVNNNYIQHLFYMGDSRWSVLIRIVEMEGFFRDNSFWIRIEFVRHEDGVYKIDFIARDR